MGRSPTPSTLQTWAAGASGGFHGWCACAGVRRPASWCLVHTELALACKGQVRPALLSCGVITNASSLPGLGGRLLRLLWTGWVWLNPSLARSGCLQVSRGSAGGEDAGAWNWESCLRASTRSLRLVRCYLDSNSVLCSLCGRSWRRARADRDGGVGCGGKLVRERGEVKRAGLGNRTVRFQIQVCCLLFHSGMGAVSRRLIW